MTAPVIKPDEIAGVVELPQIYDGWSVAIMHDGSYVNRWDPETQPGRHAATENAIKCWIAEEDTE